MIDIQEFPDRNAASTAAAAKIAGLVDAQLHRDPVASLVVSGGSTPADCFGYLSAYELEWNRVQVVLSDERWVPNVHEDSNEKMVAETLLVGNAREAGFLSVYQDDMSVDERCDSLQSEHPKNGFACSLIGMGSDGHFASLFPDADCLEAGLRLPGDRFYVPVHTEASPHPRVSMTLHGLLQSDAVLLLVFGDDKRDVLEKALDGDVSYPIAALLRQKICPLNLYWAP